MIEAIVEALAEAADVLDSTETFEDMDSAENTMSETENLDDNGKAYRTDDGGWIPNNTYELDGTEYKTDDYGHIYQHDGEYFPDDFFVKDGQLYTTDENGNLQTETPENNTESDGSDQSNLSEDSTDTQEKEQSNAQKELTPEEINEAQQKAIKEAFEKISRGEELTNAEKGNLCEMMMDQYYISKGYSPLHERVVSLDDPGHQGIDGVYEKQNSDGSKEYIIADAKYDSAKLGNTTDGKQLSDTWIDARLDSAVGKEKADEIRDSYENDPESVKRELYHYDPASDENGNSHTDLSEVDSEGQSTDKTVIEIVDKNGNTTLVDIDNNNTMEAENKYA